MNICAELECKKENSILQDKTAGMTTPIETGWIAEYNGQRFTASTQAGVLKKFNAYVNSLRIQPENRELSLYRAGTSPDTPLVVYSGYYQIV